MISTETRSFDSFELSPALKKSLAEASFENATPIQAATIPLGLERHDIIGCAQTGTGKTAAFLIPAITFLEKNPNDVCLIMAPTREIVQQITETARIFLKNHPEMRLATIIGGARMDRQLNALARKPQIIVGTPGRLNDFLARRKLHLNTCHTLVLDEADRMLDMGFAPQIDIIIKALPKNRQSVMFSATMAGPVEKLAKTYLNNPKFVSVGQKETAPDALKQKIIITSLEKKEDILLDELNSRKGSVLIFAETQRRVEKLCYKLRDFGFLAESIHGGRTQGQRFRALKCFKDGDVNILVATDVASRGLDIGNIEHVINYDLPSNPEDFLHRVGRTARNGKDGDALTLVLPADFHEYKRIQKYLKNCEVIGAFEKGVEFMPQMGSRRKRGGGGGGNRFSGGGRSFGGGGGGRSRSSGGDSRSGGEGRGRRSGGGGFRPDRPAKDSGGSNDDGSSRSFAPRSSEGGYRGDRGSSRPFGNRSERPSYASRNSEGGNREQRGERPAFNRDRSDRPAFASRNSEGGNREQRSERPAFAPRPAITEKPATSSPKLSGFKRLFQRTN
jgi:superfamily II DNA/RNA helicase